MSRDEKDEEMIYALTADERDVLLQGLNELPETMPPRAVWHRIREQAEAEGLIGVPRSRRPSTWYTSGSLAAAAALVAVILPGLLQQPGVVTPQQPFPTEPDSAAVSNSMEVSALQALMVESRQLESDLRALPEEPRVMRVSTQATIFELEDRIAAIDYQLSDPDVLMMAEDKELFWRERVRLMKSLVRLRYAQAQRTAF